MLGYCQREIAAPHLSTPHPAHSLPRPAFLPRAALAPRSLPSRLPPSPQMMTRQTYTLTNVEGEAVMADGKIVLKEKDGTRDAP